MADGQLDLQSSSKWHSLRPWNHRLSLSVLEITSVSATFVLSSLSAQTNLSSLLDGEDYEDAENATSRSSGSHQIISDALSKGLSVKVNGTPWQRVLIRIDDETDEAVIIIYGLMPGRQYDIELGIIPGEERVKGHIVTVEARNGEPESSQDAFGLNHFPGSALTDPSPSPPSPSPPGTPPTPTHSHVAVEDYLASLQSTLAHLQAEHSALLTSLKSARRDSQKSQAALRAEISQLKRTSQKHSTGDVRMRQKVRALEEAVKQAVKGREDVEAEWEITEAERATQEEERREQEQRHASVKRTAEDEQQRRLDAEADANAKVHGVKAELATIEARLDKLNARREKLEGKAGSSGSDSDSASASVTSAPRGLVGELEDRVRALQLERARIAADPYAYLAPPPPPPRFPAFRGKRFAPHPRVHNPFVGARQAQALPPHRMQQHFAGRAPGRPHAPRRKSSSPGPSPTTAASSTLSLLAPPFEPRMHAEGGFGSGQE